MDFKSNDWLEKIAKKADILKDMAKKTELEYQLKKLNEQHYMLVNGRDFGKDKNDNFKRKELSNQMVVINKELEELTKRLESDKLF